MEQCIGVSISELAGKQLSTLLFATGERQLKAFTLFTGISSYAPEKYETTVAFQTLTW